LDPAFGQGVYQMVQDAHAAGIPLQITSAYRSPEVQARLYEAAVQKYGSEAAARKWVAPPGRSKHNSGTAVDFAVNGSLLRDANSPEAQWVKANAARYGLAVPMEWEPWQVEPMGARDGTYTGQTAAQPQQPQPQQQQQERPQNKLALSYAGLDPAAFQMPTNQLAQMGFDRETNPFMRYL
jgi:LAS superfamily LD-carboxypeptidase LdcB